MTTDRANEILEKAIDLLDDDTWGQGLEREESEVGGGVRYCAVGAMRTAAGYDWSQHFSGTVATYGDYDRDTFIEAWCRANATAVRETDGECDSIVGFNDGPGRTAEDVRLMLKRALRT